MKHFNRTALRGGRLSPDGRSLVLLVWLVVALMLPNLILAFTEGYCGWSMVAGILLPLGIYLLLFIFTRRVSVVTLLLSPILALCVVQMVLLYLYGNSIIAVDMFTNIMTTNTGESRELLGGLTPITIVVALLYLPLLYVAIRQIGNSEYRLSESQRLRVIFVGGVLTIVGVQLLLPARMVANTDVVREEVFPVNVIHNFDIALRNRRMVRNYDTTSANFSHEAQRTCRMPNREIYLFVIGESSRAANWELYGYSRQTNPLLRKRSDVLLFKNVVTQSNTTHKSVPLMLSSVDAENYDDMFYRKGISDMFRSVGFYTYFISTQSPQGAMVDNLAEECDKVVYVEPSECDMQLLQTVRHIVENTEREKLFFVLHCYGSHYSYNQRYTKEFATFLPDDDGAVNAYNTEHLRNSYDNSILYTDALLDSIISYLASVDACSALLYCSDHGEDLFDDERGMFLHASPKVTYYQLHVPCLAWFSAAYLDHLPEKGIMAARHRWSPTTTSAMFHTLADMASIRSSYIDPRHSLVSALFDESAPRLYLNDRNEAVPIDRRIGITDFDLREFMLHGIQHL